VGGNFYISLTLDVYSRYDYHGGHSKEYEFDSRRFLEAIILLSHIQRNYYFVECENFILPLFRVFFNIHYKYKCIRTIRQILHLTF
jgi:hypothetical protein